MGEKQKILRIIARLNVGGPARHVVWLTKALQEPEFQSYLIAGTVPEGEESMEFFADQNGVKPIYIREMSRELSPKDAVSLYKLLREMYRIKPDIIHTHTAKAGTVGRVAAFIYKILSFRKVKIIHTFHGHIFHSYYGAAKTKLFLAIEKTLARLVTDKIVVISKQQQHEICEDFGVGRASQFSVISLGIDLSVFENADNFRNEFRQKIGAKDNEVVVGFIGRMTEIKNLPLFVNAVAEYRKLSEPKPNLKFVIVGDGNVRGEIEAQVARLGVADTIHFYGNVEDVSKVYGGIDIVALTSKNEGTPLSLIEAMAARRPFVSTIVGGVRDLLGENKEELNGFAQFERGLGVNDQSSANFMNALIFLAKNEELRHILSEKGFAFVTENYSVSRLVADIKKLYADA